MKTKNIMIYDLFWPTTSQNVFNFSRIKLIFWGNTFDMVSKKNLYSDFQFWRPRIDFNHRQVETSKFVKIKKIMIFDLLWPATLQNVFNFSRIKFIFWGNTFDMVSKKNLYSDFQFWRPRIDFNHRQVETSKFMKIKKILIFGL